MCTGWSNQQSAGVADTIKKGAISQGTVYSKNPTTGQKTRLSGSALEKAVGQTNEKIAKVKGGGYANAQSLQRQALSGPTSRATGSGGASADNRRRSRGSLRIATDNSVQVAGGGAGLRIPT